MQAHVHIIKTNFKEQFLALSYVVFACFKNSVFAFVFLMAAGHDPPTSFQEHWGRGIGFGRCGRRKMGETE